MSVRELSVFFPAHDEVENLERTMTAALAFLDDMDLDASEVIVVDDGSTDGTGDVADALALKDPRVRVVHHGSNRGYGAALKSGFGAARLEWVFYTDSDGQFDLGDLNRLLPFAGEFDAVIGYRQRRSDHFVRTVNQSLWTALVHSLFRLGLRDVDCAFKLVRRASLERVGPLVSEGAVISTELLVKLRLTGARVKQVGVNHYPRTAGRASGGSPRVIARAFRELVRLRRELHAWSATFPRL